MRFGRVVDSGDELFSARCTFPTSASVALPRQGVDDYVRFRVPDTDCPPLPEPGTPLDSGVADEAEPNRWQYGGQYISDTGWRFGATAGAALDWVQPAYTCYDGDFETQVLLSWSDAGLPHLPDILTAPFDIFGFGIGGGWGIVLGHVGYSYFYDPWNLGVYAYVAGGVGTQLGWLGPGTTATFKLKRVGSTVSVEYAGNSATVAIGLSGPVRLRLWRDFTLPNWSAMHIPSVTVFQWSTIRGAPESIWVETPVVDMGSPTRLKVRAYPQAAQLVWRAGDSLPLPPYWDNPVGEYRYWQARAASTDQRILLERIELLPAEQKVLFEVPCATRAVYVHHAQGIFSRGNAKGIVSIHRTPTDEVYDIDSERVLTVDW